MITFQAQIKNLSGAVLAETSEETSFLSMLSLLDGETLSLGAVGTTYRVRSQIANVASGTPVATMDWVIRVK